MTTEQKVSEYLNAIGAKHTNVEIVKENEAVCHIHDADQFIMAIEKENFVQYDYSENSLLDKLSSSKLANQFVKEHYFQHKTLHAYILVVEHPYHPEYNYAYLSNEPVAPKNWMTIYFEEFSLPSKEQLLLNFLDKAENLKKNIKVQFDTIKSKIFK